LATPLLESKEISDPNIVKVVMDKNGMALYFSRASIPFQRDKDEFINNGQTLRHIGIYAYRADYLKEFSSMESCSVETLEKLEQLRAMWHGTRIHVDIATEIPGHGVDTEKDLIAVEKILLAQ
ncbi:MAG: 3-deoxy-manno-octulosonate cytidylyltransferase, partial [Gammaproteobacteria bacterium]|nr:3-deoxy-manno-octulosonate cytidylyltransferase [Gammaproteobacteria bacterium]